MTLGQQILWGSLYLGACLIVEIMALVLCTSLLVKATERFKPKSGSLSVGVVLAIALAFIVLAHTMQAWIWASALILTNAMEDWNTAIYFALVSYSTLGYGDIVLGPGLRIFGAFSAVTGILAFGISTAYLVALATRSLQGALPVHLDRPDHNKGANNRATGAP